MTHTHWITLGIFCLSIIGCFYAFKLVEALRTVVESDYPATLRRYAIVMALGIFACHAGYQYATENLPKITQHPIEFLGSMLCAYLMAATLLKTVHQKKLSLLDLLSAALTTGVSGYLLTYLFQISAGAINIQLDPWVALLSLFLACLTCALAMVTILWLKGYEGAFLQRLKWMFSVEIALGFLASHTAINLSIVHNNMLLSAPSDQVASYGLLLLVLVPVFLFVTSFILVIFYERNVDITQSKLTFASTQPMHQKYMAYDPLTHLPNRDALNQHLILCAKRCDRSGESLALAYIDLDHFKPVNDQYGHHIGDLLLIEVSKRISQALRNCDYVARAGGDEFIAVLSEIDNHHSVVTVVQRVIDALRTPFTIEDHLLQISCSVGIAMYPQDGSLQKLRLHADAAMYKAKQNGKNQLRFFDAEIEQASDAMQQTRIELKEALRTHAFQLLFQPKVDVLQQRLHGAEALLRWQHPHKGLLSPSSFIEAAERFGMIEEINAWVLSQACRTIQQARAHGIELHVSVNMAHQQFRNRQLGSLIQGILDAHQVSPQQLILEVSETHAIHQQAQFRDTLQQLRQMGLQVSLDDFGLHPVSLNHLQELALSEVKLDRSLTQGIGSSAQALSVVAAIVNLAHALNLNVVAEGVEDEAQKQALVAIGCHQMQGYLFSHPVPSDTLMRLFGQWPASTGAWQSGQQH